MGFNSGFEGLNDIKVNIQFLASETGYSCLLRSSWLQVLYCILLARAEITSYICT